MKNEPLTISLKNGSVKLSNEETHDYRLKGEKLSRRELMYVAFQKIGYLFKLANGPIKT